MRSRISDSYFSQGSEKSPNARPCGDIIYSSNRNSLLSLRRKDIVNDDSNLIYLYFSGRVNREASHRDGLREPIVLGGGFAFSWQGECVCVSLLPSPPPLPPFFFLGGGVSLPSPQARLPRGGGPRGASPCLTGTSSMAWGMEWRGKSASPEPSPCGACSRSSCRR